MTNVKKRDRWESSSDEEDDYEHRNKVASSNLTSKITVRSTTSLETVNQNQNLSATNNNDPDVELALKGNDLKSTDSDANAGKDDGEKTSQDPLPLYNPLLSGCRLVYDSYERLARLDEGTYVSSLGIFSRSYKFRSLSS